VKLLNKDEDLADFEKKAVVLYETELKERLLESHLGKAVAIHPDSGDLAIGETHREAGLALLKRHAQDGRIVTLTIGPPTEKDIQLHSRFVLAELRRQGFWEKAGLEKED
jgi:hypothetical protein